MTEPLVVDPARLKNAGAKLGELVLPSPPAPMAVPGSDPVSAAIKETLPVIESPVVEGLPAINAANARTGSSITIAAGIYADTDQRLAEHVSSVDVQSVDQERTGGGGVRLLGATASGGAKDTVGDGAKANDKDGDKAKDGDKGKDGDTPTPTPAPPPQPALDYSGINRQLGQAVGMSKAMGPLMQNVQSVMSSVQGSMGGMGGGAGGGGGAPAQLASATSAADQASSDQARLVDDTKADDAKADDEAGDKPEDEATVADGAAPGGQTSAGAPVASTSGTSGTSGASGRPQVTPAGTEV